MTSPQHRRSDDEIETQAAAWLAERDGDFTPEQARAFAAWCEADPRRAAAVERLDRTWAALAQLRTYRPATRAHPDPDLLCTPTRTARRRWFPAVAVAAAAGIALAVIGFGILPREPFHAGSARIEVHRTTAAGYQRVSLPDQSVIELNEQTELSVRYTPAERRVQLVRGEAHFTVARDAARPFTVETGGASVRAVGTAFDVRVGPTATEVIVTAGRVQLARGSPSLDSAADGVSAPLLTAGWRAFIPARAAEPISTEQLESAVIREALSWQDARLLFSETPLAEVIARFNRRNRIQLVLADPELAALPISGSFRSENVEAFARLLATGGEIAFEHDGTDRIVLRRTR